MASGPITWWQIDGETMGTMTDFIFLGSEITVGDNYSHEIKRCLLLGRKTLTNLDSILKNRDIALWTEVHIIKLMVFPVVMYRYESWTMKNWCLWTVMLEKTSESPLDSKEIKPVHPKENQTWAFTGRTDVEGEAPVLGTYWRCKEPDARSQLIRKGPDAGKDWRQEEKGTAEDEMVGWHHRINGHEFEQTGR